ncbi:YdbH family protein [Biostraticola tofi]|uniref:Dicarboxylate transport n=1 Tax=Biostraticola tofi TaxID=466109 RepID=A0A4R3Z3W1_9GAMM|nr:YdbH family protein [Biostraticola tofi]TCV99846.1 dicarboxylate transport [Biostraticola tofi]
MSKGTADLPTRQSPGRAVLRILAGLLALALLAAVLLWFSFPSLAPWAARFLLADDVRLEVSGRPTWRDGHLRLPEITLWRSHCRWINAEHPDISRHEGIWRINLRQITLDTRCPSSSAAPEGGDPLSQLTTLPAIDLHLDRLVVLPWQEQGGQVSLSHRQDDTRLSFIGKQLALDLRLNDRVVSIEDIRINGVPMQPELHLQGRIELASTPELGVDKGKVNSQVSLKDGTLLDVSLAWQQRQGVLTITDNRMAITLARLPWIINGNDLRIEGGNWRWPYLTAPLSGGMSLTLSNWLSGIDTMGISARVNMLSQGLRGKANAVLAVGPGPLSITDNQLDLRLTGRANHDDLSVNIALPARLEGPLTSPRLAMLPGALVRLVGQVSDVLDIDNARLPLAGVKLTSQGIDGRLQAILAAANPQSGRLKLHLDGRASQFLPDKGTWRWRYWGGGELKPINGAWTLDGRGSWIDDTVSLTELNGRLNSLHYGLISARRPALSLKTPFHWRRSAANPSLSGEVRLAAGRIDIERAGHLDNPTINLRIFGRDPQWFNWSGKLQAGEVGPVTLSGRWDGSRLRGQAWWPRQSLRAFQPLLNPDLAITLDEGEFYAQTAFSAAPGQGLLAGGHGVVRNGDLWLGDTRLSGVDLTLSYRLADEQWQLGPHQPLSLHIDKVATPVALNQVNIAVKGYYPFSHQRPLVLTRLDTHMLGGQVSLTPLSLPQQAAAILSIDSIEMSELITALKPKQLAISGRVSGQLPIDFNSPQGYVRNGWVANDNLMALRLDRQFADAIAGKNMAAGLAIDWLRYMEITRSRATIDVSRAGELVLKAQVNGTNPQINAKRAVTLNYRHQENIFMLWQSLRFGGTLEQTVEKQASVPGGPQGDTH